MDPKSLRAELERLRGRLRGLCVLYGTLQAVFAACACLAVLYLLDRSLALPVGVRLLLLVFGLTGTGYLVYRGIIFPLRRRIRAEDVAGAVEGRFKEFDGRLISTLELAGEALAPDRNVSVALVELLRKETGELRQGKRFEAIFDLKHLRRMLALAVVLLALDVGFGVMKPDLAGIFFQRLFGGDARWPQDTFLLVEFPANAEHFSVEYAGDQPKIVRMARGASLPVTVVVRGKSPDFVELRTRSEASSGNRLGPMGLSPTAGSEWVGRFRNVRDSFEFWPHDGNPNDDGAAVAVEVFTPPGVVSVATRLQFPAYTRLAPRSVPRGDVEAPIGTVVAVEVTVTGEIDQGHVVFDVGQDSPRLGRAGDDSDRWLASFTVSKSCSYSVQLLGKNGFRNLKSTDYAVIAVKDRSPTVRLIEPARANLDVTPSGLVPFRVAADDDYGVESLTLSLVPFGSEAESQFDLLADAAPSAFAGRSLVYRLIDLSRNPFPHEDAVRPSQVGDSYIYQVVGEDNYSRGDGQGPNRTVVADRRFDVISVNEKMRLLTEQQIRMKDDVRALRDLQGMKHQGLSDALVDFEASEGDNEPGVDELAGLEVGQNQVTNRAVRLAQDFAQLYEEYLLNRMDHSAAAERLIPLLAERKLASTLVEGFDFSIYRPVVDSYQDGAFGNLDVLGRLLGMLSCILDVAEIESPAAGRALSDARLLVDNNQRPGGVRAALAAQERALAKLDQLLERMDEWEDFQEILTLFRDLLDNQRDLNARTRSTLRTEGG
ncbi:MAG: DUF4175 family protein [Planctomycetota bacterium]